MGEKGKIVAPNVLCSSLFHRSNHLDWRERNNHV
jgi:hypothetical protein